MGQLEGKWIAGALIPGLIIAILFYFDHSVSAQLAQMPEFNVRRPTAYHYDLALLGVTTIICGILGVPPPQGSLPQAPLHSRSLATMRSTAIHSRLTVRVWTTFTPSLWMLTKARNGAWIGTESQYVCRCQGPPVLHDGLCVARPWLGDACDLWGKWVLMGALGGSLHRSRVLELAMSKAESMRSQTEAALSVLTNVAGQLRSKICCCLFRPMFWSPFAA